jgi:hypothetical protein
VRTDGTPFVLLKTGHLLHHRYSRIRRERTEIYDPATTSWSAAAPGYYLRLVGGLYLAEAASVLLAAAPRGMWRYLARRLDAPDAVTGLVFDRIERRHLASFRFDALGVVALYAAATLAYGRHAWMLATAVAARALIVSVATTPITTAPGWRRRWRP